MEFSADKITFMWKDANSNTGDCPGISKVPGGYLVQGVPVGPATHEALRAKAHLAADGEADDGGHVAGGVDLADTVVESVGDELIAVRVEDDIGGIAEVDCGR